MKKFKEVTVLALSFIMLFSVAIPTQAKLSCAICGNTQIDQQTALGNCYTTRCDSQVFNTFCPSCDRLYRVCTAGHIWDS